MKLLDDYHYCLQMKELYKQIGAPNQASAIATMSCGDKIMGLLVAIVVVVLIGFFYFKKWRSKKK